MRTVFHLTTADRRAQQLALANVSNLLADDTVSLDSVAVVCNGDGVWLLQEGSAHTDRIETLAADGVSFRACSNSLEGRHLAPEDLLAVVTLVSSGVAELTRLQSDGYAYIRP